MRSSADSNNSRSRPLVVSTFAATFLPLDFGPQPIVPSVDNDTSNNIVTLRSFIKLPSRYTRTVYGQRVRRRIENCSYKRLILYPGPSYSDAKHTKAVAQLPANAAFQLPDRPYQTQRIPPRSFLPQQ